MSFDGMEGNLQRFVKRSLNVVKLEIGICNNIIKDMKIASNVFEKILMILVNGLFISIFNYVMLKYLILIANVRLEN